MSIATLFKEFENALTPRNSSTIRRVEREEDYIVEAIVAGVRPEDIQVSFERGVLSIEAQTDGYQYSYLIPMPTERIDSASIPDAVTENGILKMTFPKKEASKPLKISVKSSVQDLA